MPGSAVHVIGSGEIDLRKIKRADPVRPRADARCPSCCGSSRPATFTWRSSSTNTARPGHRDAGRRDRGDRRRDRGRVRSGAARTRFHRGGRRLPRQRASSRCTSCATRLKLDDLDADDVDTIGGYIIQQLGRWPRPGDTLPIGDYTARVLSVQQRRVGQVLLTPKAPENEEAK